MSFKVYKGKVKQIWLPVTVSTAFAKDSIVSVVSGFLVPATAASTALSNTGVIARAIISTDLDFAVARRVPVLVPIEKNVEWLGDVTGGLVAADAGLLVDLTDGLTVNRGASAIDAALVRKVITATKGVFVLNLQGSTGQGE